jgi:hypothetical protein
MTAIASPEVVLAMKSNERVVVEIDDENNVTAATTVAAVGTSPGNVFLPAEADHPVAAIPTADKYLGLVVKHGSNG